MIRILVFVFVSVVFLGQIGTNQTNKKTPKQETKLQENREERDYLGRVRT